MIVFSNTDAAAREGFFIDDFDRENRLFIVVKDTVRGQFRVRMRAFAQVDAEELARSAAEPDSLN